MKRNTNKILIVFFILFIFICLWIFYKKSYENFFSASSEIVVPKIIWTYWDNPNSLPDVVKYCIHGWIKHNPNYEIKILTLNNYETYVIIPEKIKNHPNYKDTTQRFSDLLRCYVLTEYGGIWCDASVIMNKPLDDWLFPMKTDFSGFYLETMAGNSPVETQHPLIESWFFACTKDSEFMKLWKDEFSKLADYATVDDYIHSRINEYKINPGIIPSYLLSYLAIYISSQKVLQYDNYPLEKLTLRKSEDGPFLYLVNANWHSETAAEMFYIEDYEIKVKDKKYETPIMKLRSYDRNAIESKIKNK